MAVRIRIPPPPQRGMVDRTIFEIRLGQYRTREPSVETVSLPVNLFHGP